MQLLKLFTPFLSILYAVHSVAPVSSEGRLERWVHLGLQLVQWNQLHHCLHTSSRSEADCRRLLHLPLPSVAVYVSEPHSTAGLSDKVHVILPDSSNEMLNSKLRGSFSMGRMLNRGSGPLRDQQPLHGSMAHDAVLVLDPSPGENFGHPVFLFYVDLNVTKKRCSHQDGIYLGEECLTLALKGRCQNQLKRHQTSPERLFNNNRLTSGILRGGVGGSHLLNQAIRGFCEVHFLPLVVSDGDSSRTQRLRCVEHAEFARCPQLLPISSPSLPISSCELNKNTRRCHPQTVATHLSCRLYQTCDHAVLISG
ncbi:uncharacterized protein LOC106534062 [Austrofundulus limnaeus]|uniref:Uncharacterized protein LOC106534062 n=1 Tax=Austrofundulus limnaeus TaxID=52670 RepID=A0A2I4D192_AUSLI|nr:PREDICTED: uncharacterized protein LOC106534062 [Austrofundulus limnaeus]